MLLPLFGEVAPSAEVGYRGSRLVLDTINLRGALTASGTVCAPPEQELFDRYLCWFTTVGYLPVPPQNGRNAR